MNQKYLLITIVLILIGVVLLVSFELRNPEKDSISSEKVQPNAELNKEALKPAIPEELSLVSPDERIPYQSELEAIADEYLTAYFTDVALVNCPYYEGGGAMYRECLQTLLKSETSNVSEQSVSDAKSRCDEHISKYLASEQVDGSNIVGEFKTVCIAAYSVNR